MRSLDPTPTTAILNCSIYTVRQKKETTFLVCINLLSRNVIQQNLVLLLLMVIFDVTYLISGIYTNFHRLLCKKCDVTMV